MDLEISQKIIKKLVKNKNKISFAESCTGGLLTSSIVSVSGSSKVLEMGLVTYSNNSKKSLLKVSKKLIKRYGSVSPQCCLSMLKGLSKISNCKFCVSITGIAGPKGGNKHKPVGLVYVGIKAGKEIILNKFKFKNKGRIYIQKKTVKRVLKLILENI